MLIRENKIYCDGSHYIAIPHTTRPKQGRKNNATDKDEPTPDKPPTKKEIFDELYRDSFYMPKSERKESIVQEMRKHFNSDEQTAAFVEEQIERKKRNAIVRRTRLSRKVYLQQWNYFCTFTYDSDKHTEDSFKKKLSNCLAHLSNRKGWKYIGVWERSPEKNRLHFHSLTYIPDGAMVGELIQVTDYDTTAHRKQTTLQNTYFNEKFGRSDFKELIPLLLPKAVSYLVKYLEKSGGKLVYSRGLPMYFISDVMEEDVACTIGQEDRKLLLFDNFNCWDDGDYIGVVSDNVIKYLRKSN